MTEESTINKWRHDTPGIDNNIHFNNAGAALMPSSVIEAIKSHIDLEAQLGGYEAAAYAANEIQGFYQNLAIAFGGSSENYAYTSNATDAYSRALSSVIFKPDDVILTSSNDYASNFISFLSLRKRFGINIIVAENTEIGTIDLVSFEELVAMHRPKLVSITHIPTNSGLIQPVASIGKICRAHDVTYLVDGCQSAGQLDVRIPEIGCDFYSATFRKFLRGPRGSGFLYVNDRILKSDMHPLFLDMRGADWTSNESFTLRPQASRFEDWENPYALLLGARAALAYANEVGFPTIEGRTIKLAEILRSELQDIPGIKLLDRGVKKAAIVTLSVPNFEAGNIKALLNQHKVNCSIVSKVSARIDFEEKGVDWALRFSPHYYNTEKEIGRVVEVMASLVLA